MRLSLNAVIITLAVFLISCSVFETSEKKAEAQFTVDSTLLTGQVLNMNISYGSKSHEYSNNDFQSRENPTTAELATPIIETSTDGKLSVEFQLSDSETEQQISGGSFQLDLKEDWRYSVYIFSDSAGTDPMQGCFGCGGYFSFAYSSEKTSSDNDSLYVIWGGNSISDPVDY